MHVEVVRTADSEYESFRVRPWIRTIERQIRIEEEAAVHVGLHVSPENRVVVRRSNLELVVPYEPRVDVLELVVAIPRARRLGTLLGEESQLVERGRAFGLVGDVFAALAAPARAPVIPVLQRRGRPYGIDTRVAQHRSVRCNNRLVQVRLVRE